MLGFGIRVYVLGWLCLVACVPPYACVPFGIFIHEIVCLMIYGHLPSSVYTLSAFRFDLMRFPIHDGVDGGLIPTNIPTQDIISLFVVLSLL